MPMLRAEPAMVRTAASRSAAVRSGCLALAMSSTWARVIFPTLSVCGLAEPFWIPAAFLIRIVAGGVISVPEAEGRKLTVLSLALSYEEVRAFILGLTQSAPPQSTTKTQIYNAASGLVQALAYMGSTKPLTIAEYATIWLMLFKGTPRFPAPDREVERRGGEWNAETEADWTYYFQTHLADQPTQDNLRFALAFEAERMTRARLVQADLDKEFSVVRNELEIGENSPAEILRQRILRAAFTWHGYGRDTIGSRSDIEHAPIASLRAFYRRYYRPDNAQLTVAGHFQPERVMQWIAATFGAIPRPPQPLPLTYTVEPGPRAYLGGVLVRGNLGTARALIDGPLADGPAPRGQLR